MKPQLRYQTVVLILFTCSWLASGSLSPVQAQMSMQAIVSSLADDEYAYNWDDTATVDIDESIDGICMDEKRRCTLRAALAEASSLNNGNGGPCIATITVSGTINLSGPLYPPPGSTIQSNVDITIAGSSNDISLIGIDSNTTIRGLTFKGGQFMMQVTGNYNTIVNNRFEGAAYDAIDVFGNYNTIGGKWDTEGNVIVGVKQNGIMLIGDGNIVRGNRIGIEFSGDTLGNGFGIFVTGSYNTIGARLGDSSNVISGNHYAGITLSGTRDAGILCKHNNIIGNYIGTNFQTSQTKGNLNGIEIVGADSNNIGEYDLTFRNIISGNANSGILIGYDSKEITIWNNYIGIDESGQYRLPNREGVTLGPGTRDCYVVYNKISGNTKYGVAIFGGPDISNLYSNYHSIYGNELALNGLDGVFIGNRAENNIIGSSLTVDNYPNRLHRNGRSGIALGSVGNSILALQNTIRKNSWLDNGRQGIIIENAQDDINKPKLISYQRINGMRRAVVVGIHDRPGSRIDFYTGEKILTNHVEGRRWLGDGTMGSDTNFYLTTPITSARYILATATDPAGNTSEFSDSLAVNTTRRRRINRGANSISMSGSGSSSPSSSIPGASGSAYSWSGGSYPTMMRNAMRTNTSGSYVAVDTLVSGVGYWIKCDSATTDSVTEFLQIEDTIDVVSGWNFIGSISDPIAVSQIVSIPGGLATSQFFGYDSSYFIGDTIQPGYAYWVKVNTPGSLILAVYDTLPTSGFITIVPDTAMPPPPPPQVLGNTTTAQLSLNQGWNMASVPVVVSNFQTSALFPGTTTTVYSYQGGSYSAQTTLANGPGYWAKYGAPAAVSMTGTPILLDTLDVALAAAEVRLTGKGRLLIRKSGTEPLVRVMAECEDAGLLVEVVDGIVAAVEAAV